MADKTNLPCTSHGETFAHHETCRPEIGFAEKHMSNAAQPRHAERRASRTDGALTTRAAALYHPRFSCESIQL